MRSALVISALILVGSLGCRVFDPASQPGASSAPVVPGQSDAVFTTARASFREALDDFAGRHPKKPEQPIEFPHNLHYCKKIGCTE